MATISSSINNTYMMYRMAQSNGLSLFGGSSVDKAGSAGSSSINSMWQAYTDSGSAASSALSGLSGINSSRAALVSSYDEAASAFKAELGSTMKDLSSSVAAMKKLDFHMGEGAIKETSTTTADGKTVASKTYSKELQSVLDTVKDFAKDYNTALDLFSDYGDVSKKMKLMGRTFSDTTARADTYAAIGLNVGSDGKLSVDEGKLAQAITESPDRVEGILGKNGLAGKAESHVSFANGQSDKLFPTLNSMFGGQLAKASVYTGNSLLHLSSYATMGNLVNMLL